MQLKSRPRKRARRKPAPPRKANALRALTSSAMALPGIANANEVPGKVTAEYDFSWYSEDDLASSKVAPGGETGRYEIFMNEFHLRYPVAGRVELGFDIVHETMSGATPWYVIPDTNGEPIQVMTGATIEDERTDALISGRYYLDSGRAKLSAGVSKEKDYLAFNAGIDGEYDFNDRNTTLLTGGGLSIDRIEPTDAELDPFRPKKENKQSYSVFAGIAQVMRRDASLQSTLTYQHSTGYLSDPYKRALVLGTPQGDSRPDSRNQFSWLTRYRHHFSKMDGSLHADYQLYVDDWSVTSHTLELAWYQTLWHTLRLIPSFRYYTQSQAEFYGPWFNEIRSDGNYSSDYRLSPYGALSWGLKAETRFPTWKVDWKVALSWERYLSDGSFAIGKVRDENPGLVSFNLVSLSLKASF